MGVARFAYTPMIPSMQSDTNMGDALAGWLAGWNYLGYLLGVLLITRLSNLVLKDQFYRLGLLMAVLTTLMMGLGDSPWLWGLSRFLAGVSTAMGMILSSGLILYWLMQAGRRAELGLHFSGIGLGIALGALLIEYSAQFFNWQEQWYLLAALGGVFLLPAWLALPRPKKELTQRDPIAADPSGPNRRWIMLLQVAYLFAGYAYVVYATFIVVIVEKQPALQGQGLWLWLLVGIVATPSTIFWDRIARVSGHITALQLAFIINLLSLILPVFDNSLFFALLSAIFFGVTFVGIVSLVLTMAGICYPSSPSQLMAKLTISFCLAQIIGPIIAGEIAELSGNFDAALSTLR